MIAMRRFLQFRIFTLLIFTAIVALAIGFYLRMPTGEVEEITQVEFKQKVLASNSPVFVLFCADWCQPCRVVKPWLNEAAYEQRWQTTVYSVDVDDSPEIIKQLGITAIPAMMVFQDGAVKAQRVGLSEKATFFELLAEARQPSS